MAKMSEALPKVFVIGSSTTLLMDRYLERMSRGRFAYGRKGREAASMGAAMVDLDRPAGASAGDTGQVLNYLQTLDWPESERPNLVLMHVGFHDIKRDVTTGRSQVGLLAFEANVRAIVAWFDERGIELVWMRAGPLDEAWHNARQQRFHRYEADMAAYNAHAEAVMAEHGVAVMDLSGFTKSLGPLSETLKDHVHFKDAVVQQQAAYVMGWASGHLSRRG